MDSNNCIIGLIKVLLCLTFSLSNNEITQLPEKVFSSGSGCPKESNKERCKPWKFTKRFSLKAGAVSKYYLVAEYRSIFLRLTKDMLDVNKSYFHHIDLQSTRIVRDETDVKSLVAKLQSH